MNRKELEAFAREATKSIKTEKDLSDFSQMLTKITVETALNAELDEHLGYDKYQASGVMREEAAADSSGLGIYFVLSRLLFSIDRF